MIYKIDAIFRNAQTAIEQEYNDFARAKAYEIQGIVKKLNAILGEDAVNVEFVAASYEENEASSYYWEFFLSKFWVPLDCFNNFVEVLTDESDFIDLEAVDGCEDLLHQLYNAMKLFDSIGAPGLNNKIEVSEKNILISIEACINGRRY